MKKILAIGCLMFCISATFVVNASNNAKIEKHTMISHDQELSSNVLNAYSFDMASANVTFDKASNAALLVMVAPSPLVVEFNRVCGYAEWIPFGDVQTKYHCKWLFNPLKLC